jgi:hypothetical protein
MVESVGCVAMHSLLEVICAGLAVVTPAGDRREVGKGGQWEGGEDEGGMDSVVCTLVLLRAVRARARRGGGAGGGSTSVGSCVGRGVVVATGGSWGLR